MLDLALHYGRGPVLLKDIAQRQGISQKYLGHLIGPLKASGLISSSRGAHGGYILAGPPEDITLKDVIQAVEGNLALVECVSKPEICSRVEACVARDVWSLMSKTLLRLLEGVTLKDMVDQQRQKRQTHPLVYNI